MLLLLLIARSCLDLPQPQHLPNLPQQVAGAHNTSGYSSNCASMLQENTTHRC
jgi:hypothetical protein